MEKIKILMVGNSVGLDGEIGTRSELYMLLEEHHYGFHNWKL